jgi:hypothetical protein
MPARIVSWQRPRGREGVLRMRIGTCLDGVDRPLTERLVSDPWMFYAEATRSLSEGVDRVAEVAARRVL